MRNSGHTYKNQTRELHKILLDLSQSSKITESQKEILGILPLITLELSRGDVCPACGSHDVANEGPEDETSCHNCSYQFEG